MSVKIRLRRMGARKRPFYRLVVADARSPRDGRFIEAIGTYDPLASPAVIKVDAERVKEWISKGARPTDIARQLLVSEGILERSGPVYEKVERAPKPSKKQLAKAAAAASAAAEPATPADAAPAEEAPPEAADAAPEPAPAAAEGEEAPAAEAPASAEGEEAPAAEAPAAAGGEAAEADRDQQPAAVEPNPEAEGPAVTERPAEEKAP